MPPFAGPPEQPRRWDKPSEPPQKLLSRDFILLFCMAMFSNSYIAVFYCFEQWLEGLSISPNWRGVLLSSLFAMVLLCRPLASVLLLKRGKLLAMLASIMVSSCVMLAYPYVRGEHVIGIIWLLRIIQGIALAVYSSCTVAVLVSCIPKGQSARGFALFSLTMLLPYSIIPALAERLLPVLGGEPRLFALTAVLGLPALAAICAAVVVCTLLGVAIERVAYKPLREAPSLAVLITAIGMSYLLQNLALLIWGSAPKSFTSVVSIEPLRLFGGQLVVTGETLVTIVTSAVIMVALTLFVNKTKVGHAMQAVSEDKGAAQLMGINVNATISLTFAIGSALAAVAGVLLCSAYPTLMPTTGAMPGIKAFVAAVFGGIGSIPGAMLGGVLLGIIESLSKAYISSQMADAIVFGVLIIVLLVRPAGILGKQTREKV